MGEKEFLTALEEDTRRQCRKIREKAEKEAEAMIKRVIEESERLREEGIRKADTFIQRERIRRLTNARLYSRDLLLREKRRAIARVLEEVSNRFKILRGDKDYLEILGRLLKEAMEKWHTSMKDKEAIVVVSKEDIPLTKNLITSMECEIISEGREDMSPGVMMMSKDKRYKMINTLHSRLEKARPELESLIDSTLFEGI